MRILSALKATVFVCLAVVPKSMQYPLTSTFMDQLTALPSVPSSNDDIDISHILQRRAPPKKFSGGRTIVQEEVSHDQLFDKWRLHKIANQSQDKLEKWEKRLKAYRSMDPKESDATIAHYKKFGEGKKIQLQGWQKMQYFKELDKNWRQEYQKQDGTLASTSTANHQYTPTSPPTSEALVENHEVTELL